MLQKNRHHPTVQIPQWPTLTEYPPSDTDSSDSDLADPPIDIYSCDEFRIYDFKVRRCPRGRSHDWTDCPYAHPGEKARRRDPRRFHYSGTPCPDFKKGNCLKGDTCEFAHGVFECWLHPTKYRTQPCKDGTGCRRRVCFFAHTPEQLRVLSPKSSGKAATSSSVSDSYDGSPMRMMKGGLCFSPTSILSAEFSPFSSSSSLSPPVSPDGLAVMLMRKMRVSEAAGARAKRGVLVFDADINGSGNINDGCDNFDGLDVGWISELVK